MDIKDKKKAEVKKEPVIYEPHLLYDALIPFKFYTDTRTSGEVEYPNWHTNIEILFAVEGTGTVKLDGREYTFSKGDAMVVNANTIHIMSSESFLKYYFLIIDRDFCIANGISTDRLFFTEKITDKKIESYFADVENAYTCDNQEYRACKIRLAVLGLLVYLREYYVAKEGRFPDSVKDMSVDRIRRCMVYIRRNLDRRINLEEIAAYAGISKFYFSREFREMTGQTVFEYINIVRCSEAKRLIGEGMTVSAAAAACGFENMSYFSRTYKKYIGVLPSSGKESR